MSDLLDNDENDDTVFTFQVKKSDLAYLSNYWELRNNTDIVAWAINLLQDFTKLDEKSWRIILAKIDSERGEKIEVSKDFHQMLVNLLELRPENKMVFRLKPELLEKSMKIEQVKPAAPKKKRNK